VQILPPPPQKRLGQNFLIDPNIVRKIVAAAALDPGETVLEIGPGRGILTRTLCETANTVIALEIDQHLVEYLKKTLTCPNLDLRHDDALRFAYETLPDHTVVVANLPYYISTPLLFTLLEAKDRIDRMVLMLQTEVAERIVASPNTEDYGILSILTQYRAETKIAFRVSKNCFRPRPDVDSAIITLRMRPHPSVSTPNEALFVKLVRAAFAHRRKTLMNSLRDEGFLPTQLAHALSRADINPTRRAETLSIPEFAALTDALALTSPSSPYPN
jgi:16S rRNA (adenine1518-N6/adenine1519-N6)-dimethyltransferase